MALPDFELGPLELQEVAAAEAVVAPASACVTVNGQELLLRLCHGGYGRLHLFLRRHFPRSPILLFESELISPTQLSQGLLWKQEGFEIKQPIGDLQAAHTKDKLSSLIHYLLTEGKFCRKLAFPSPTPEKMIALKLGRDYCAWAPTLIASGGIIFQPPYSLEDAAEWALNIPDAQVLERVEREMRDTSSDCYFSWNWMQLEESEQMRQMARFVRGNYDELLQILRAATYLMLLPDSVGCMAEWFLYLPSYVEETPRGTTPPEHFATFIPHASGHDEFAARRKRWLVVIYAYFLPYYDAALGRYSIVKRITASIEGTFELYCGVESPTQHERLETRLQLREWLRDKVSPEEMSFLLGDS